MDKLHSWMNSSTCVLRNNLRCEAQSVYIPQGSLDTEDQKTHEMSGDSNQTFMAGYCLKGKVVMGALMLARN